MASQDENGYGIYRIDPLIGNKAVILQKPGDNLFAPAFSSDGQWIAFESCPRDLRAGDKAEQIFVAPLKGSLPVSPERWIPITGLDHFDSDTAWSRDGNLLYFTSICDGSNWLWAVRLDSPTKKPVREPYAVRHFHANPCQFSSAIWPLFAVGPDRIFINPEQVQSELWMMQLPPDR